MRKRTNIVIETAYTDEIMRRYGYRTMTEAVDHALRVLAARPMTKEELLGMRGAGGIERIPDEPPIREI